jgi:hypothetical protein
MDMSKMPYIVAAIVFVVIVAIGALYWPGMSHRGTANSQTTTVPQGLTTTVPHAPTTSVSYLSALCPCLSESQMQAMINASAAESPDFVFVINSTSNHSLIASFVPANFSGSLTDAWRAVYTNANGTIGVTEFVIETTNASGLYNISSRASGKEYSTFVYGVNGFTYTYTLSRTNGTTPRTMLMLYGYKNGYAVSLNATSINGLPPAGTIASEIAPMLGNR